MGQPDHLGMRGCFRDRNREGLRMNFLSHKFACRISTNKRPDNVTLAWGNPGIHLSNAFVRAYSGNLCDETTLLSQPAAQF